MYEQPEVINIIMTHDTSVGCDRVMYNVEGGYVVRNDCSTARGEEWLHPLEQKGVTHN